MNPTSGVPLAGIALSVLASVLFAVLSGYTLLLAPLSGMSIFAWRVLFTVPGALLLLHVRQQWPAFSALLARFRNEPHLWWALPALAALFGVQQWLFMWAPVNGEAMSVAMGYFLLPLTMVLFGRVLYREHLYRMQWLAVACALAGVLHELWLTRALAWPTLVVALGYPPYFVLRRWVKLEPLTGFTLEMLLLLPFALWMLRLEAPSSIAVLEHGRFWLLLPGLGLISTVALLCYLASSRLLPLGMMGILGYVEPVLLFMLAITVMGEPMTPARLLTYGPIWLAVVLTVLHIAHRQRLFSLGWLTARGVLRGRRRSG
ncbi:EamA family transporter RarD [Crenobacter intestini]|uniref:EamA family transporter RarD n=1 Tax=Crenobacter intestini TaxID=2563443 RepID=A0A4T0UW55_9NEIS|nr:EamA family transporter RarD [Crenobacter intestini]TIC83178.1 EamA family transporter RarD [Crenobacter intestini]